MAKTWEIRGLFGNEFAMEGAIEELKKHQGLEWVKLDRRNLSVRLAKRDRELEELIKRAVDIYHGWIESEAPLGEFDAKKAAEKAKKTKEFEEKRARMAKQKH